MEDVSGPKEIPMVPQIDNLPNIAALRRTGKDLTIAFRNWASSTGILALTGQINYDPGRMVRLESIKEGRHFWDIGFDSTALFREPKRPLLVQWVEYLSTQMTQDAVGRDLGCVDPVSYIDDGSLTIDNSPRLEGFGLANFRSGIRQIFSQNSLDYLETRGTSRERLSAVLLPFKVGGIIPFERGEVNAIALSGMKQSDVEWLNWVRQKVKDNTIRA